MLTPNQCGLIVAAHVSTHARFDDVVGRMAEAMVAVHVSKLMLSLMMPLGKWLRRHSDRWWPRM